LPRCKSLLGTCPQDPLTSAVEFVITTYLRHYHYLRFTTLFLKCHCRSETVHQFIMQQFCGCNVVTINSQDCSRARTSIGVVQQRGGALPRCKSLLGTYPPFSLLDQQATCRPCGVGYILLWLLYFRGGN